MAHLVNLAGMVIIALLLGAAAQLGEVAVLRPLVGNFENEQMDVDQWLKIFAAWSSYCLYVAAGAYLLWYAIGALSQPAYGRNTSKRAIWTLLLALPGIMANVAFFQLPAARAGTMVAWAFLVLNSLIMYWLPSALFSPTMVKTDPIGSRSLRKVRDNVLPDRGA